MAEMEPAMPARDTNKTPPPKTPPKRKNAFEELMSPKSKKPAIDDRVGVRPNHRKTTTTPGGNSYFGRDGLLAYMVEPEAFDKRRVIYYDDDWVLIHDLYPKASVHMLLIPRDMEISAMNPLDAFREVDGLLERTRKELQKAVPIAVSELEHLFSKDSAQDKARREAMDSDDPPPPEDLPKGRDWLKELKIGVHANPSMNHLHVHIISRDMHATPLKKRQHYNSFNTEFFVRMDEMPLGEEEALARRMGASETLNRDFICWRTGKNFGNSMVRLKAHLEEQWTAWRKE